MITIFRVENEAGIGPYAADWDLFIMGSADRNPAPQFDGISPEFEDRFGFKDLDQLIDWFDLWLDPLEKNGFRVVKITLAENRIQYGRRQVAFREYKNRLAPREIVPWSEVKAAV